MPWPKADTGRCRMPECREVGFCIAGGCEGTTRSYWSMARRRFFVMHGQELCKFEGCDGRHQKGEEWRTGWNRLGQEDGLQTLNRQRRVVMWLGKGDCYVSAKEEAM